MADEQIRVWVGPRRFAGTPVRLWLAAVLAAPLTLGLAYCSAHIGPSIPDDQAADAAAPAAVDAGPAPGAPVPGRPQAVPAPAASGAPGSAPAPPGTSPVPLPLGPDWYVLTGGVRVSVPAARVVDKELVITAKVWNQGDDKPFAWSLVRATVPRPGGGTLTCSPWRSDMARQGPPMVSVAPGQTADVDLRCYGGDAPPSVALTLTTLGERQALTFVGSIGTASGAPATPAPGTAVSGPPTGTP